MAEAFPAVIVPFLRNTGLSFAIDSIEASARKCSSRSTTDAFPPFATVTGAISRAKCPLSQAAAAREFGRALTDIGLEVAFADERLTTWDAAARARDADGAGATHRRSAANAIDSAAAALILEQYLADRRPPEEP